MARVVAIVSDLMLASRVTTRRVHGVGLEVEHQRRAFWRVRFSAAPAAAGRQGQRRQGGRQRRDDPCHDRATLAVRRGRPRGA